MHQWIHYHPWRFRAYVLVPLLAGLVSLLKGQDGNWDLRNYHLYNPWAWLNDRISTDLAPAGIQSYFNPLIDLPYFAMIEYLPAPLVGFVMGAIHGLAFIPAFIVCRACLGESQDRERTAFWLALAGALSIGILAGLGNSMGDNLTAIAVLSGVAILVARWSPDEPPSGQRLLWVGVSLGLATGLKLTNAIHVAAACAAVLLCHPGGQARRFKAAVCLGLMSLAVFCLVAGFWHLRLWQEFGNPLYPQFNSVFASPLAADGLAADQRWQPDGWLQAIFWPLLISGDPSLAGDKPLPQIGFAVAYLMSLLWLGAKLTAPWTKWSPRPLEPVQAAVFCFLVVAFMVWMPVFGVYRYLIPLEFLVPLVIWLIATHLWSGRTGRRVAFWLVLVTVLYSVANFTTWGVRPWALETARVEPPSIQDPSATVFVLTAGEPMSWMIPWLPEESTYVSLGRMPESPAYVERAKEIMRRHDDAYALVYTHQRMGPLRVARLNDWLQSSLVEDDDRLCRALDFLSEFSGSIEPDAARGEVDSPAPSCRFEYVKFSEEELAGMNRRELERARQVLEEYGVELLPDSCRRYRAYLGAEPEPYRVCRLRLDK